MQKLLFAAAIAVVTAPVYAQSGLTEDIQQDYNTNLEALYRHFHAHPELSFMEDETAARMAEELRQAGFEVTEQVGKTGVVAVMKNGDGPVLMLRADMDGLPVKEQTGLPFASEVVAENRRGEPQPVMHACAHDTHITALIGAAHALSERQDQWSGTLILIVQPAEELGLGALAMLEDGLYQRFPTPDQVVAFHTFSQIPAGTIGYAPGYAMANVDSVDIYVKGIGGHGAAPHQAKDPIALSGYLITALQTLVSRELNPLESGVVTVGAIHGGTKHNIIPNEVHLQLTVRSYTNEARQKLLDGIRRIARAQAASFGLPEELMPVVEVSEPYTPATYNDPELTRRAVSALEDRFGDEAVVELEPIMGGEDFSQYGRTDEDVPTFMFWVGGTPQDVIEAYAEKGQNPPPNHSPFFAPDAETAVTMGAEGLAAIALDILGR